MFKHLYDYCIIVVIVSPSCSHLLEFEVTSKVTSKSMTATDIGFHSIDLKGKQLSL